MKIQYCSDLHLEMGKNSAFIERHPLKSAGEVLLIAGDCTYANLEYFKDPFFDAVSRQYRLVFVVPGNHEFYKGPDTSILNSPVNKKIRDNVFLVSNVVATHKGVSFIFTTLWSRIGAKNRAVIEQDMNDFRLIRRNGSPITADHYNTMFEQSFAFLQKAVSGRKKGKTVVVTHHVPSFECITGSRRNDPLSEAYATELRSFVFGSRVDFWIYGHTHVNVGTVRIGKTVLLTNQLGYVLIRENRTFKTNAHFDV